MVDKKYNALDILGSSGLKVSGGIISEDFMRNLQGLKGVEMYREMIDNSSTVGAVNYLIKTLIRQVDSFIEPFDSSDEAIDLANFVEEAIEDMSQTFDDFVSDSISFLDYGWSYFEILYKLRKGKTGKSTTNSKFNDGKYGWRKFALRSQDTLERWEISDEDDGILGLHQSDPNRSKQAYIPIEKALLFRTETFKNNPEGRSIYRSSVMDWITLKKMMMIEAIGVERDMTGVLDMQLPLECMLTNATPEAKAMRADVEKQLGEFKRDERAFITRPVEIDSAGKQTGYILKLLSTGGSRQIDTNAIKTYYKTSILQSVLAQFLQLGQQSVGSFALASSSTNTFALSIGNYLNIIANTFSRFAINRLIQINKLNMELCPYLAFGDIETPSLPEIGAYIQALSTTGNMPINDEGIQSKLLGYANLPLPKNEHELVEPYKAPSEVDEDETITGETNPDTNLDTTKGCGCEPRSRISKNAIKVKRSK